MRGELRNSCGIAWAFHSGTRRHDGQTKPNLLYEKLLLDCASRDSVKPFIYMPSRTYCCSLEESIVRKATSWSARFVLLARFMAISLPSEETSDCSLIYKYTHNPRNTFAINPLSHRFLTTSTLTVYLLHPTCRLSTILADY